MPRPEINIGQRTTKRFTVGQVPPGEFFKRTGVYEALMRLNEEIISTRLGRSVARCLSLHDGKRIYVNTKHSVTPLRLKRADFEEVP